MEECIFCKIVAGSIPSEKVYEDEHTYVFLDIKPVHLGHTLVIPKVHAEDIFDIKEKDWLEVMKTVHLFAPKIKTATGADGVNIIMNNKRSAGQLVDHAHVHIVPRFKNDGFKGLPQHDELKETLTKMAEKIKNLL